MKRAGWSPSHSSRSWSLSLCLHLPLSLSIFTVHPSQSRQKVQAAAELPLPTRHCRYPSEHQVIQLRRAAFTSEALVSSRKA